MTIDGFLIINVDNTMPNSINILYFAALAETLNCHNESLEIPREIKNVEQLRTHLSQRENQWLALNDNNIRCAVNQDIVKFNHPICTGDEVAFFPPVTGG